MSLCLWVVRGVLGVLVWYWGGSSHYFFFGPAEPPAQCRARVWVKSRYLKRRTVEFSSLSYLLKYGAPFHPDVSVR